MSTEKITLQHTRQGTYWPDIEICTLEGDILRVEKSQIKTGSEYFIIAQDDEGYPTELKDDNTDEEFWLAYNPSLDRYYVRSKVKDKAFLTPQHTTGHKALFHHPSRTVIWVIPRNGSCTLLASLMKDRGESPNTLQPGRTWRSREAHTCYFEEDKNVLSQPEKWIDYHHCIVYQDPELRCLRNMNYILSVNRPQLATFFSEFQEKMQNVSTFMDTYLAIAEINLYNEPEYYEASLKPQLWFHKTLPVTPELIIKLDDLEEFLKKELKIKPEPANIENSIYLSLSAYTEERKKKVEKLYGEDRIIETRFRDRLWS